MNVTSLLEKEKKGSTAVYTHSRQIVVAFFKFAPSKKRKIFDRISGGNRLFILDALIMR